MNPRRMKLGLTILVAATTFGGTGCGCGAKPPSSEKNEVGEAAEKHESGGHDAHGDEVKLSPEAMQLYQVRAEPATKRRLVEAIAVPARVAFDAETTAHVGTPVEGRVAEIRARLGDAVRAGDTLLVIDSPALGEAQSDFLQKRAAVTVARAGYEVAKNAYERAKELSEGKGISKGEVLRREGEFKAAGGSLAAAESGAVTAENKLHLYGMTDPQVSALAQSGEIRPRYEVRTPVAGTVVEREATLGEIVGPDRERLFVVADPSVLWVLGDVPENRSAEVRAGAKARVTASALGERTIEGSVSFVASALEPATRTLEVRIVVKDGDTGLKPGMFVQAEIASSGKSGEAPEALAVPEAAVQTMEGSTGVFVSVPGEENTFAKRVVTVGPTVGRMVPILSGLSEGEAVVVSGTFILKAELGKASAEHEH